MTIEVMETEIGKPASPVVKPVYGESMNFGMMSGYGGYGGYGRMGMGMGMGMEEGGPGGMSPSYAGSMRSMMMGRGGMQGGRAAAMEGMMAPMEGMMRGGAPTIAKKGTDIRNVNKASERKDQAKKEAGANKAAAKAKVDLYYNIIEVTVYGQARFYNAPPAPTPDQPSTAAAEAPKAPEAETPAKAEAPAPTTPAPTPEAPKAETPKAETPKAETPKTEAPAGETPPTTKPDEPTPKR
jgi:hypothetical protein